MIEASVVLGLRVAYVFHHIALGRKLLGDARSTRPNILLITTDQQRFDSLGCNGNSVCRTPAIDSLAAAGVRYERAHAQNVLCTPSRSTIVTGQYPGTHGVWNNGVCLPREWPTVAHVL